MDKKIKWKRIAGQFPVNEKFIWLNNCGTTPAGNFAVKAMAAYMTEYANAGIFTKKYAWEDVHGNIKRVLCKLLSSLPNELALIHNTAEGMNFISYGLNLKAGDEILIMEDEYPSNVYPWEHWQAKGIRLITVPIGECPADFVRAFSRSIRSRTRLAAISAVHWCTGMPLPMAEIGAICKQHNIFFIVDGAQGVGHVPINVRAWGIDAMCFSAWKWLLGPLGLGVMIIREKLLDQIEYVFKGANSVANDRQYLPYQKALKHGADRYTFSTPNFNDWVYFNASLHYLEKIGFANVMNRIYELTAALGDDLKKAGLTIMTDQFPDVKTAILAAGREDIDAKRLSQKLMARRIIVSERRGMIRFAPHIYNSREQLKKTVETIKQLI